LAGYEDLLKDDHLPGTMRQTAMIRVAVLTIQNQRRLDLTATLKNQGEAEARLSAIETAKATLEQRMAANGAVYTAVGLLQGSSVQSGGQQLYRLTDPATGRTLCYVRIGEAKTVGFLEKFVGVKGDLTSDPNVSFKVIPATEIAIVDPAAVNKSITAQVAPPSLIGTVTPQGQANTGNN